MWRELQDPDPAYGKKWFIEHVLCTKFYRDKLGRIIYFKTREAACKRVWELNSKESEKSNVKI